MFALSLKISMYFHSISCINKELPHIRHSVLLHTVWIYMVATLCLVSNNSLIYIICFTEMDRMLFGNT